MDNHVETPNYYDFLETVYLFIFETVCIKFHWWIQQFFPSVTSSEAVVHDYKNLRGSLLTFQKTSV